MREPGSRGFTMVEMLITILVLGLLFAFSIPAFNRLSSSYQLKGATETLAGALRLTRERAIATGTPQSIHFNTFIPGTDWHVHDGATTIPGGKLPNGITWYLAGVHPSFAPDGRTQFGVSGFLVVQDSRGNRDTVSVLSSGLVLTQ